MTGFKQLSVVMIAVLLLQGCASQQTDENSDYDQQTAAEAGPDSADSSDDFALDEKSDSAQSDKNKDAQTEDELKLDDESSQQQEQAVNENKQDQIQELEDEKPKEAPQEVVQEQVPPPQETAPAEPAPAPVVAEEPPPQQAEPAPVVAQSSAPVKIKNIQYKANDNGGTVVIEANGPITYTTRTNPELKQYIVEIPNSILPARLKRPLNTRDVRGSIGAIDPYQLSGSDVSRFVIQMREGAAEPVIQQEGHALLVIASALPEPKPVVENKEQAPAGPDEDNLDVNDPRILDSQSLADFLSGNTQFYGKKISIEMADMDVRDALRFIMDESGINMIITDGVQGKLSLKLRQVPWDQALVAIMKARGLGYSRQGSILRIAPQDSLKVEEETATKLAKDRQGVEALKVRVFPVSYAKVDELSGKIKDFLSERGKVIADPRTSTVVVTDIEDNLVRVGKLINSLDTQPPQVLIEAKIVEAKESFTRGIGVNWGLNGGEMTTGGKRIAPTLNVAPGSASGGALNFGLDVGTFDFLGDLSAQLALNEREEKVRVISSPRIMTMSNEAATIKESTEVPVRTVTTTGTSTQSSFSFKPLQLLLDVTPQITSDSSVIMKVNVKREFKGAILDSANESFSTNSREATTRVLVKNGQTAVIGGIYQSDVSEGETGVPYLREIPVLGNLFKGNSISKEKSELMLFLTPRILATEESGSGAPKTSDIEVH